MVTKMKNLRLQKVSSYINKEDKLADIGCDHGYLAQMAIEKGVDFVQLIDNKEGPLSSAKQNLSKYTFEDGLTLLYSLSSGLNDLNNEVDTVAICGMGGELISQIIEEDRNKAKRLKKLILQPNSKVAFLRRYLLSNHFEILDEDIIEDAGKVYEIVVARYNVNAYEFSKKQVIFGPVLMKKKQPLFMLKWKKKLNLNKKIIANLSVNDEKYQMILEEIQMIEEVLYEN